MGRRGHRRAGWRWIVALAALVVVCAWLGIRAIDGGDVKTGSSEARGTKVLRYSVHSKAVGKTLRQVALVPPGGGKDRPLLVFLHGKGDDGEESNVNAAFLKALAAQGDDAPNVAFPNGANHSYWHNRADGRWGDYVLTEAIPRALKETGANPDRVAIGGISMGGFGAYDVASRMPNAFCAVGGHSAATWIESGQSAPGAFDDAEDFERHDVIELAETRGHRAWGRAKLWLDNGSGDPFLQADASFAKLLGIKHHVWPGNHSGSYWSAHYDDYLRFYSRALARCR